MDHLVSDVLDPIRQRAVHFNELLTDRLYFVTLSDVNAKIFHKKSNPSVHYLFVDNELVYQPFNKDFGPLNLAMLYQYCKKVKTHLKCKSTVVHLTTLDQAKRANAAFLIGSYCIIYHQLTVKEVCRRLGEISVGYSGYKTFTPFVHAGVEECHFYLTLEDCFNAISKALKHKFINFDTFDLKTYQFYEMVEHGDFNWIIPDKFIAFCDPQTYSISKNSSLNYHCKYFAQQNVSTIIRLNKSSYNAKGFTSKGFQHYDLIFTDGSNPSDQIMNEFLSICESAPGAIAVHCKAGLGRTGTLIACYMMKHYHFTATEAIAWIRICRPGSIIGYQQSWLVRKQPLLWAQRVNLTTNKVCDSSSTKLDINSCKEASEDIANNNNLEIRAVKCRVVNNNNNNNVQHCNNDNDHKSQANSQLNKLIFELDNFNFDDLNNLTQNHSSNNIDKNETFTQGDFLNEIKLNRATKMANSNSKRHTGTTCGKRMKPAELESMLKIVHLDPNNNFTNNMTSKTVAVDTKLPHQSLKLIGKRMHKYPSNVSKILPH